MFGSTGVFEPKNIRFIYLALYQGAQRNRFMYTSSKVHPPKFNSEFTPESHGGWKTILSYWEGHFSGAMLHFGRVSALAANVSEDVLKKHICNPAH